MKNRFGLYRRPTRRGVLYVHVIFTALIVSLIATTALRSFRSQSQELLLLSDFEEAKRYAHAAMEIALLKMQQDLAWRNNLGDGNWVTLATMGNGKYSISVSDQIDADIGNDASDAVTIHAVGTKGTARFQLEVDVSTNPDKQSCLGVALMSGTSMSISSSVISTNQVIASNASITAASSSIHSDSEARVAINGSGYSGAKTVTGSSRLMPDTNSLFQSYLSSGTSFSAATLPQFQSSEILLNTTFETNVNHWVEIGDDCELERTTSEKRTGNSSLLVKSRDSHASLAAQILQTDHPGLARFIPGHLYRLTFPTKVGENVDCKAVCILTDSNNTQLTYGMEAAWTNAKKEYALHNGFQPITLEFRPFFTGSIQRCEVKVVFRTDDSDYFIDDPSLVDITYPNGARVLERMAISPTNNPYGATNANGIYVINCAGNNVVIGFARIAGTVILQNAGPLSGVYGPVSWETLSSWLPALMSDQSLVMSMTNVGLNEADLDLNLNPAASPWPYEGGQSNLTKTDSYASRINGLVYAQSGIQLNGVFNLKGVAVTSGGFSSQGATVGVEYDPVIAQNPPPGFRLGQLELSLVRGSWKQIVD